MANGEACEPLQQNFIVQQFQQTIGEKRRVIFCSSVNQSIAVIKEKRPRESNLFNLSMLTAETRKKETTLLVAPKGKAKILKYATTFVFLLNGKTLSNEMFIEIRLCLS